VTPRLRTDIWVAALRRRAESQGAYVSIARRGSAEAGAVFVLVDCRNGTFDLYGPAPQSLLYDDESADRLFSCIAAAASPEEIQVRMESEIRFDSDLWQVDIEDGKGRAFVEIAADPTIQRFTSR
jgi:hypothetical protein